MHKFNTHFIVLKYFLSISLILFFSILVNANQNLNKLIVPNGFEISILANNLDSPRQIAETSKGHIIVGSKKGTEVIALTKTNNDKTYKKVIVANSLKNPAGVAVFNGDLYFAEMDTIWIIKDIDSWLESNSEILPKKKIYMNNLPSETWHGLKYIDFGPDGNLYIPVGVP